MLIKTIAPDIDHLIPNLSKACEVFDLSRDSRGGEQASNLSNFRMRVMVVFLNTKEKLF